MSGSVTSVKPIKNSTKQDMDVGISSVLIDLPVFLLKVLMFVMTDPPPCGSGGVGDPPSLLVHSSLCGNAAES